MPSRAADRARLYVGFDRHRASLHVGNMATIMLLRRLQQAGTSRSC
jgi:tyrosyl-tRNA synthetase